MRRTFAPLGALMLGAALAVVPPAAPAGASDTRGGAVATIRGEARTVVRQYGGAPVRQRDADEPLKIRFRGEKGDRVLVTQGRRGNNVLPLVSVSRLTDERGVVLRHGRLWWRLRRDGWHTFRVRSLYGRPVTAQLTKVRAVDVERDADPRRLPVRRGYLWAAGFEVPAQGLLSGTVAGVGTQLLVRPDKLQPRYLDRTSIVLGDGMPVATGEAFRFPRSRAQRAGAVIRVLTAGGLASAVTPEQLTGAVDGPAVSLAAQQDHAVEVVVDGAAGAWVDVDSPTVDTGVQTTLLLDPDRHYVDPSALRGLWQLTATGRSSLLVFPSSGPAASEVRLASVAVSPTLVPDGAPVRVTADPTRATMLPIGPTPAYTKLVASNATFVGDWRGYLLVAHVPHYPPSCLGCGERNLVEVSPAMPMSAASSGTWVYLPASNGAGTIDLQALTSTYSRSAHPAG